MQTNHPPNSLNNHTVLGLAASVIWNSYHPATCANSQHQPSKVTMQTLQEILAQRNLSALFQPTTLSIGAIWAVPGMFDSHHEISEAATVAKKMAKKTPGNSLFIERRELQQFEQGSILRM